MEAAGAVAPETEVPMQENPTTPPHSGRGFAVVAFIVAALAATYLAAHLVAFIADVPLVYVPVLWIILLGLLALVNALLLWRSS